jgi:hypothetical protein
MPHLYTWHLDYICINIEVDLQAHYHTTTMRMKMRMSCSLTLLHLGIWASALQIVSMKMAMDNAPNDITHMNTYLDEDDFESEFGLEQIDDPREARQGRVKP